MFTRFAAPAALLLVASTGSVFGQEWDATKSAKGWARFDPIGAATFYDATTKRLITWMKDAGVTSQIEVSKAEFEPERWVADDDRAWVMAGNQMKLLSKTGQVQRTVSLPAEVADVDFLPPDGLVLTYRTLTPLVERRDIKTGTVVWSYGEKPKKEQVTSRTLHRILRNDSSNIMLVSDGELAATTLEGKKGTLLGQAIFAFNDKMPPRISLGTKPRGAFVWWWGTNIAFCAVAGSTLPGLGMQDLVLAKMDNSASTLEFKPTGLTEEFTLAGVQDGRAVFIAPNGGLVYIPVQ